MVLRNKYHRAHEPEIADEVETRMFDLASTRPKEHGLAAEQRSISALLQFVCEHADATNFARLANAGKSVVWHIHDDNDTRRRKIPTTRKSMIRIDRKMQEALVAYRDVFPYTEGDPLRS